MIDRRHLLATAGAAGACVAMPAWAQGPSTTGDARLRAVLDRFAEARLADVPETATTLGLDTGARAGLRSRLDDYSESGVAAGRAIAARTRGELAAIDAGTLTGRDRTTYEAVGYALGLVEEGARFDFGVRGLGAIGGNVSPYVVTQSQGTYANVPEFLNAQHRIETVADAQAYLARLDALGPAMDAERARVEADAAKGVIAPDFILETVVEQLARARAVEAANTTMVRSLAERTLARGIAGDWATRAERTVDGRVFPAIDRLLATVTSVRGRATDDAGAWKLPDGAAYYAHLLKVFTTTSLSADAIYEIGLTQAREIDARMDAILWRQGMAHGSVGERMAALTADPRFVYPDTDAGRAQVLAYVEGRIAALRALMPRVSRLGLKAEVQVKRTPVEIEDGAALGYMNFAALDGTRPAIYYINLKSTANWPRWTLASLTAHEALPGHGWHGAYLAERRADIPLVQSLMGFGAFIEGWALYAEQLADEGGLYADDPFGELGYLQALGFRAARLVVDTGLHDKRWTRERAIDWMTAQTGRARTAITSEVHRYCANPGQACSYKVGHNEIVRLRARAQAGMGARWDARGFNDALVATGGVPLAVLEGVVDRWAAARDA